MKKDQKAVFFHFQVFKLDNLPGFNKRHRPAIIMIIPGAAVHHCARPYLFKADHVKISCKFGAAYRTDHYIIGAMVYANERMLRHCKAVIAVQFA